ncbi:hypothetical protein AKO1_000853 [Acrasis kona]|uniref:Uncharacterized protein n=1 Tax=Acrasis kona TaxID=1008807 RepID=A0AAW2ZE30_9EUKA
MRGNYVEPITFKAWRKKWERNWDTIKYCSEKCKKNRLDSLDEQLENYIMNSLQQRSDLMRTGRGQELRALTGRVDNVMVTSDEVEQAHSQKENELPQPEKQTDKISLYERTRQAARRLTDQGSVRITNSKGQNADPSFIKGTMFIKLPE